MENATSSRESKESQVEDKGKFKVLVVGRSLYDVEEIASELQETLEADVFTCFRAYNLGPFIDKYQPDVIVGDGTCKDKDGNGQSEPVLWSDEMYDLIKSKKLKLIQIWSYKFAPLLILRLWWFKITK